MTEPGAPVRAVFVDPTGRRGRLVARACWLLGGLGVAYVAVVLVALLLPPGLSRLTVPGLGAVLPGPAAAPLGAAQGEVRAPDALLAPPTPRASRSTAPSTGPRPSVAPTQRTAPAGSPTTPPAQSRSAAPRSSDASTPAPTAAPGASPDAPAPTPATAPTQKATQAPSAPPGSTRAPKPRPSPTRGPR